jgi:hypothetical protein
VLKETVSRPKVDLMSIAINMMPFLIMKKGSYRKVNLKSQPGKMKTRALRLRERSLIEEKNLIEYANPCKIKSKGLTMKNSRRVIIY